MIKKYLITLDPGKKQDPAALQVWRLTPVMHHADPLLAVPKHIMYKDDLVMQYELQDKRYTELARFAHDLMTREGVKYNAVIAFDCTGVGEAVKDMLYEKGIRDMIPILYTSSGKVRYIYKDSANQDPRFSSGGKQSPMLKRLDQVNVPKAVMVECAKIAMEKQEIRLVPGVPYLSRFRLQMEEFRGKMSDKGYESFNNSSDEIHDEWVNCFMMRSWVRQKFQKAITKEEGQLMNGRQEIADILGDDD